ncbi:unnamed protein product [Staurois parvus]|uniref:Uncharacterized protein n=1 Tax=Staurois parvus TaxID=386267 RepID=A0ABN9E0D0_9NEOB|nr:unnamed protein product [Staurois parvus]
MPLTLGVSGKNVPYIGGQWEECPLHWGSVGRMSLTLGVSGKNVPYIVGQWEKEEDLTLKELSLRRMFLQAWALPASLAQEPCLIQGEALGRDSPDETGPSEGRRWRT